MSINKFEEAIAKGFKDMESAQRSFELQREIKQLSDASKYTNSRLLENERLLQAIYQKTGGPLLDNLEAMFKAFSSASKEFYANVKQLNETISKFNDVEGDPKLFDEKQRKLGEYVR